MIRMIFKISLALNLLLVGYSAKASTPITNSEAQMDKDISDIYIKGSLGSQRVLWVMPLTEVSFEKSQDLQIATEIMAPLFDPAAYKRGVEFLTGDMGIMSPIVVTREAINGIKAIWQDSQLALTTKNNSVRGSISVKSTIIRMNKIKYLVVDVPLNSIKTAGIVVGAGAWATGLTLILPTAGGGLMTLVVGATLSSYMLRASYSVLSTSTFATVYLLNKDVKDIFGMIVRKATANNKCAKVL
jgi:hypothetical protein